MRWLLLLLVMGCNQLYDLDATTVRPPQMDRDLDGVGDDDDNCLDVFNDLQEDLDKDGFGDACDGCPIATAENHDEDGDGRGDDCDLCPHLPDFDLDADMDGTGDLCETLIDSTPRTTLVGFEGFGVRKPAWYSSTIEWKQAKDAIVPVATTPVTDPGLRNDAFTLATRDFTAVIGVTARESWIVGDRVGITLVDDTGTQLYGCWLACDEPNMCHHELGHGNAFVPGITRPALPVEVLYLEIRQGTVLCISRFGNSTVITNATLTVPVTHLRAALHASPTKQIDYLVLFEER